MVFAFVVLVAVAFGRVVLDQRDHHAELDELARVDQRFRKLAQPVRVAGRAGAMVALGVGTRAADTYELIASELVLVTARDERIHVRAGAHLRAIVRRGTFVANTLRVPAGTELLARTPPLVDEGHAGHAGDARGELEVRAGEAITLVDPEADLGEIARNRRVAHWPRTLMLAGALAGVVASGSAPLMWLAAALIAVDQLALRGTGMAIACTKWHSR